MARRKHRSLPRGTHKISCLLRQCHVRSSPESKLSPLVAECPLWVTDLGCSREVHFASDSDQTYRLRNGSVVWRSHGNRHRKTIGYHCALHAGGRLAKSLIRSRGIGNGPADWLFI